MTVLVDRSRYISLLAVRRVCFCAHSRRYWSHSRRIFYRREWLHPNFPPRRVHDFCWPTLCHDRSTAFAHHHVVVVSVLAIRNRSLDVVVSSVGRWVPAVQLRKQVGTSHAQSNISALPCGRVEWIIVRSRDKRIVAIQALLRERDLRCVSILRDLRYRFHHDWCDGEDVLWPNNRANVAETGEGIPHERVQLQRVDVVLDGFLAVAVSCPKLPKQTETRCCVWNMPS